MSTKNDTVYNKQNENSRPVVIINMKWGMENFAVGIFVQGDVNPRSSAFDHLN